MNQFTALLCFVSLSRTLLIPPPLICLFSNGFYSTLSNFVFWIFSSPRYDARYRINLAIRLGRILLVILADLENTKNGYLWNCSFCKLPEISIKHHHVGDKTWKSFNCIMHAPWLPSPKSWARECINLLSHHYARLGGAKRESHWELQ